MTGLRRTLHVFRVFLVEGLSASVLCFCLCTPGLAIPLAEPVPATTEDLLQMTEESLYADWQRTAPSSEAWGAWCRTRLRAGSWRAGAP